MTRVALSLRRPVVGAAVLLAVYGLLSLLVAGHGQLGTDTGGKVATVEAMVRSGGDPDVGYWAEALDPEGEHHPLFYTSRIGDRWINATTLPMLHAARPLYDLGGYRLMLLIPMIGTVAAALAGRALADRLGSDRPWLAFWVIGLASPAAIYALDFWEHSVGLALSLWAAVTLHDVASRRRPTWFAFVPGLLVGAGATMRTEALVYGFVMTAVAVLVLARRRRWSQALAVGASVVVGLVLVVGANHALEVASTGEGIRLDRAAGAADRGVSDNAPGSRLDDAITTTINLDANQTGSGYARGAMLVAALALVVVASRRSGETAARLVFFGVVTAAALYLTRFMSGWGFVPGFLAAAPLALVGVFAAFDHTFPRRAVVVAAVGSLPLVWAFQYVGGAAPQWGGRYQLPASTVLVVAGVVAVAGASTLVRRSFVVASIVVTAFGFGWLVERSSSVHEVEQVLDAHADDVLVSRVAHLFREAGAVYAPDRRWLTAISDGGLTEALRILDRSDVDRFGIIATGSSGEPEVVAGFTASASERFAFLGVPLTIQFYERVD